MLRRHGPSYRKVLNHVVQLAMALPPPYERKPLAWQWNRKVRPPAERPAMAPCITVCPFARRPTHFYTFNLAELESEKYSFFAVAAEGCIHCLRQKYDADPHLVHAVSEDRQYTALDYAIWEAQKHPEDAAFDAVLVFCSRQGAAPTTTRTSSCTATLAVAPQGPQAPIAVA